MVTCDDVNALVAMCSISQEKAITSLKQCSSSLFVLLYQRLFNCTIKGIESSPYTVEQKKWNVKCVLNELQDKRGINIDGIDAEQIVQLNEEHISRLILLFLKIAERMKLQVNVNAPSPPSATGTFTSMLYSFPTITNITPRPVLAEIPHEFSEGGMWYAPVNNNNINNNEEIIIEEDMHQQQNQRGGYGYSQQIAMEHLKLETDRIRQQQEIQQLQLQQQQQHSIGISREIPQVVMHATHVNDTGIFMTPHSADIHQRSNININNNINSEDDDEDEEAMEDHIKDANDEVESDGSYGNIGEEKIPTSQLVEAWNEAVIPPDNNSFADNNSELADVRERLGIIDERLIDAEREYKRRQQYQQQKQKHQRSMNINTSHTTNMSAHIPRGTGVLGVNHNNINNNNNNNIDTSSISCSTSRKRKKMQDYNINKSNNNVPLPRSLIPDTLHSDELLRQQPKRMIDYTLRNEKIEMLRSLRFIDELQKDIRRKIVQQHSEATRELRAEVRQQLEEDKNEKRERRRQIREEDQKYRNAYAAMMAAACNDLRIAKHLMLDRTRQLAAYQKQSLQESKRMCRYMKEESKERMRHDLLRYASTVTGWQSKFVS